MTSQLMVKIDTGLKQRVAKKAKKNDLTLSDLVKMAFHAYDQGLMEPKLVLQERLKPSVIKELKKISKDIKEGKNLSPGFTSAKEMNDYLDSL